MKHSAVRMKPFLAVREDAPKRRPDIKASIKQRGAIMWKIFSLLYRAYCRARVAEIRRYNFAKTT
jgi:hypothetical protein